MPVTLVKARQPARHSGSGTSPTRIATPARASVGRRAGTEHPVCGENAHVPESELSRQTEVCASTTSPNHCATTRGRPIGSDATAASLWALSTAWRACFGKTCGRSCDASVLPVGGDGTFVRSERVVVVAWGGKDHGVSRMAVSPVIHWTGGQCLDPGAT